MRGRPFALAVLAWVLWSSSLARDPRTGQIVPLLDRVSTHATREECEFTADRQIAQLAARLNWEIRGRHVVSPDKGTITHFNCLPSEAMPLK